MDVKFLERIPGTRERLYQFTAIDDCTRIRVLNGDGAVVASKPPLIAVFRILSSGARGSAPLQGG